MTAADSTPGESQPDSTSATGLEKAGRAALLAKRFGAAENYCRQILDSNPRSAEAHFVLAMIAVETGQTLPAAKLLQRSVAFAPGNAEYLAQLGRVLVMLNETAAATKAACRALELRPEDALTLDTIGCVFSFTGDHSRAIAPFMKATERQPDNSDFRYNLATSLRFMGDIDAACTEYEQIIQQNSTYYKAHWSLSNLQRQTSAQNHLKRLGDTLSGVGNNTEAQAFLHNALAKEYDDLDDADRSFEHLTRGKNLLRSKIDYSTDEDRRIFRCIRELFTTELLEQLPDNSTKDRPIFVVGMPRTGTTLVERIISSHSKILSAGEPRTLGLTLKRLSGSGTKQIIDADTVEKGLKISPALLASTYIDTLKQLAIQAPFIVDKTPLNFLYIGFIHRALPNAKIICVRRNPLDTCLSNFRHLFSPESAPYYRYSYNLLETGHYYLLFDEMMAHWERVLPERVLQVNYEDVVSDQEEQSRRLIDYCGLDWEPACLSFEKNQAPVATASSAQVRQPIYTSAAARWKRYEQHLQPLRDLLESHGIRIN